MFGNLQSNYAGKHQFKQKSGPSVATRDADDLHSPKPTAKNDILRTGSRQGMNTKKKTVQVLDHRERDRDLAKSYDLETKPMMMKNNRSRSCMNDPEPTSKSAKNPKSHQNMTRRDTNSTITSFGDPLLYCCCRYSGKRVTYLSRKPLIAYLYHIFPKHVRQNPSGEHLRHQPQAWGRGGPPKLRPLGWTRICLISGIPE